MTQSACPSARRLLGLAACWLASLVWLSARAPALANELRLDARQLRQVPNSTILCASMSLADQLISGERRVNLLNLADNQIGRLEANAFTCLASALKVLSLSYNHIEDISGEAFASLSHLQVLLLDHNRLARVPARETFDPMRSLRHLSLANNRIGVLQSDAFASPALAGLISLNLKANPLHFIGSEAFAPLANLKTLTLTQSAFVGLLGPFAGLAELKFLHADRSRGLDDIEANVCKRSPKLQSLVLRSNRLTRVPQFASDCSALQILDLSYNRLSSTLSGANFSRTPNLLDLYLNNNQLEWIHSDAFERLRRLEVLNLSSNQLKRIHPLAFQPLAGSLLELNVANNGQLADLTAANPLVNQLRSLKAFGCPQLRRLPHFRAAELLALTFAYHCCDYLGAEQAQLAAPAGRPTNSLASVWLSLSSLLGANESASGSRDSQKDDGDEANNLTELILWPSGLVGPQVDQKTDPRQTLQRPPAEQTVEPAGVMNSSARERLARQTHNEPLMMDELERVRASHSADVLERAMLTQQSASERRRTARSAALDRQPARTSAPRCLPAPNSLLPCADLLDAWWLRVAVWLVFLLAFAGNLLVIAVLASIGPSSSSSALTSIMWLAHSKRHIDVPRFLVLNLAFADLLMSVYLGLLAFVDLSTLGEFRLFAIKWQNSSACQLAGFLAILSSELSVFILAIITLERNYAITNAVHLNRRLSLQKAMLTMLVGYAFALAMALLPLNGFGDYRRVSVCLPLYLAGQPGAHSRSNYQRQLAGDQQPQTDAEQTTDQLYLGALVGVNALSFLLLLGCYLRMYCAIRGSQAWNTNDLRIAKRMSVLVLTDFLCWSPILVVAGASLAGKQLVASEGLKVLTIFVLPLNSVANPFLYAITTKKFKRDLDTLLRRIGLFARLTWRRAACNRLEPNEFHCHANKASSQAAVQYQRQQQLLLAESRRARTAGKQRLATPASACAPLDRRARTAADLSATSRRPHQSANRCICGRITGLDQPAELSRPRIVLDSVDYLSSAAQVKMHSPAGQSSATPPTEVPAAPTRAHSDERMAQSVQLERLQTNSCRYLCVLAHQPQAQANIDRSASACGYPVDQSAGDQLAAKSADKLSRSISRLLFGPIAKAWSSVHLSLRDSTGERLGDERADDLRPTHERDHCCSTEDQLIGSANNLDQQTLSNADEHLLLNKWQLIGRRMSRSCDTIVAARLQSSPTSPSDLNEAATSSTQGDLSDDRRILLATINRMASAGRHTSVQREQSGASVGAGRRYLRSRCTRCRSWSPALLGKLEDCIHQLRSKFPGFTGAKCTDDSTLPGQANHSGQVEMSATRTSTGDQPTGADGDPDSDSYSAAERADDLGELCDLHGHQLASDDQFNERHLLDWTERRRVAPNRHRVRRQMSASSRLLQRQTSATSDTMSTKTAATILTNTSSSSFDSATNIPPAPTGQAAQQSPEPQAGRPEEATVSDSQ